MGLDRRRLSCWTRSILCCCYPCLKHNLLSENLTGRIYGKAIWDMETPPSPRTLQWSEDLVYSTAATEILHEEQAKEDTKVTAEDLNVAIIFRQHLTNQGSAQEIAVVRSQLRDTLAQHGLSARVEERCRRNGGDYQDMQMVVPRVWIGPMHPLSQHAKEATKRGITHVLTAINLPPHHPLLNELKLNPRIHDHLLVHVADDDGENIMQHFEKAVKCAPCQRGFSSLLTLPPQLSR